MTSGAWQKSLIRIVAAKLGIYEITQKRDTLLLYSDHLRMEELKPLLREENRGKVDTAMRLLKLIELLPLLKESGIFGKLGG